MTLEWKEFKITMAKCDGGKKLRCAMSQSQLWKFKGITVRINKNELSWAKCKVRRVTWRVANQNITSLKE